MRLLATIILALALTGCAAGLQALQSLTRAGQGAQWLGSVLDVASAGAEAYFARHPQQEASQEVTAALAAARQALETLDSVLAAGDAYSAGDHEAARAAAVRAYGRARDALERYRVLSGDPPDGGAIGEAPEPRPLLLPSVADVDERL